MDFPCLEVILHENKLLVLPLTIETHYVFEVFRDERIIFLRFACNFPEPTSCFQQLFKRRLLRYLEVHFIALLVWFAMLSP